MRNEVRTAVGAVVFAIVAVLTGACDGMDTTPIAATGNCDPDGVDILQPDTCKKDKNQHENPTTDEAPPPAATGCDPHGVSIFGGCPDGSSSGPDTHDIPPPSYLTPADIKRVTEHEAGHVVVLNEYGWTVTYSHFTPDSSITDAETLGDVPYDVDPVKEVAYLEAGAVAAGTMKGAEKDYSDVDDYLSQYDDNDRGRIEAAGHAEAVKIVHKRAAEVTRIAKQLQLHGRL